MLTTVKLYGHLGREFGRVHQFNIDSPAEAFHALRANFKGFREYLIDNSEPGYRVLVDGLPQTVEMLQSLTGFPSGPDGTPVIRVVPVVQGAGDGKGIGMIIGGVVLAIITIGAAIAFELPAWAVGLGASLSLSMTTAGVSSLLSPQPPTAVVEQREEEKRRRQYAFNSLSPTITEGVPIPIHYGRVTVVGYPVSVRLSVVHDTSV